MVSVTLRVKWCAAHRLMHHPGRCSVLHGHNYVADITVAEMGPPTNRVHPLTGMVVDFAAVKATVAKWIDENWDHNTILNTADPAFKILPIPETRRRFFGREPFAMVGEPTAENMALFLLGGAGQLSTLEEDHGVRITKVDLWETDSCCATACRSESPSRKE